MSKEIENEAIITAAQELFAEKGAMTVTPEEIAARADMDIKKLKTHYADVEQILDEILERDIADSSELFTKIINDRGKADIKLTRLVRELLTRYQKSYPLFQVISMSIDNNAADDQVLRGCMKQEHLDRYRQNTAIIGRLIAQGQSEGLFTDVDPLEGAYLLRGMIGAAIRFRKVTGRNDNMRDHADVVMRVFLKGLLR